MSEYQAMSIAQILDDPDAPETLKIRARNQQAQQQEQLSVAAMEEKAFMERLSRMLMSAPPRKDRKRTGNGQAGNGIG